MIVSSIDASNRTPSNKSFLVTELDKGVLTSDSGQTTAIGRKVQYGMSTGEYHTCLYFLPYFPIQLLLGTSLLSYWIVRLNLECIAPIVLDS